MTQRSTRHWSKPLSEVLIAAFVLWHMAAIAVSSIPTDAKDPVAPSIKKYAGPVVHPYLMLTSQWQLWNIFSPEPLRQVSDYRLERMEQYSWIEVRTLSEKTVPPHRRADTFKLLGRIEERHELWSPYLAYQCEDLKLPPGTFLRIVRRSYVLPADDAASIPGRWHGWEPEWHDTNLSHLYCP